MYCFFPVGTFSQILQVNNYSLQQKFELKSHFSEFLQKHLSTTKISSLFRFSTDIIVIKEKAKFISLEIPMCAQEKNILKYYNAATKRNQNRIVENYSNIINGK